MTGPIIIKVQVFPYHGEDHALMYDEHDAHHWIGIAPDEVLKRMRGRKRAFFYIASWSPIDEPPNLLDEAPAQLW